MASCCSWDLNFTISKMKPYGACHSSQTSISLPRKDCRDSSSRPRRLFVSRLSPTCEQEKTVNKTCSRQCECRVLRPKWDLGQQSAEKSLGGPTASPSELLAYGNPSVLSGTKAARWGHEAATHKKVFRRFLSCLPPLHAWIQMVVDFCQLHGNITNV